MAGQINVNKFQVGKLEKKKLLEASGHEYKEITEF
jgi:hypothetical protein